MCRAVDLSSIGGELSPAQGVLFLKGVRPPHVVPLNKEFRGDISKPPTSGHARRWGVIDRALALVGIAVGLLTYLWGYGPEGWPKMPTWAVYVGVGLSTLLVGIALGLVLGDRRNDRPSDVSIRPRFFSLFGRYKLGQVNVYERDEKGEPLGRTLNLIEERDKVVRVKPIIRGLYYQVELVKPDTVAIALLKRSDRDKGWRTVHFGILG